MKVLYLAGEGGSDAATTEQIARAAPQLHVTPAASLEEAVAETRRGGWTGLLFSPTFAAAQVVTMIAKLRRDRVPIAIVPVVTIWDQEFFASAVAAGADDVLLIRGEAAVHSAETLSRIRHSPHLVPAEERRLRALYIGKDTLVWNLLEQVPFLKAERAASTADGAIVGRQPVPGTDPLNTDTVIIDDEPADAPPLQVVKFIRAHAPDLPVVVLAGPTAGETASGVLDLGVDDCIPKSGIYRRRLIASLNRIYQRHELALQHVAVKTRETRLRQIVENLPEALAIVSADGTVLAVNAAGLPLFGVTRPADIVGRELLTLVKPEQQEDARAFIARVCGGQPGGMSIEIDALDKVRRALQVDATTLERDARGARGAIAVLRPPRQLTPPEAKAIQAKVEAISTAADQRVRAAAADVQKLADTHRAERSAWDAARAQLEERLQALMTDADARQGIDMRLASAETELREIASAREQLSADLAQARTELAVALAARQRLETDMAAAHADAATVRATYEREREQWARDQATFAQQRQELQSAVDAHGNLDRQVESAQAAVQSLTASRDELTAQLEAARAEQRQAIEEHLVERNAAETYRRSLEARVQESRGDVDARARLERELADAEQARGAAERSLEALASELAAARAEIDTLRSTLDRAQHDAQASRQDVDAMRDELDAARAARAADRATLDRVDGELASVRAALATRSDELEAARAERDAARLAEQRIRDDQSEERAAAEVARAQQDARLADAQAAAVARVELEARLEAARADLRQATDTFSAERAGWEATRRQLESRLHEMQAAAGARSDIEAQLDAVRVELQQAREAAARDRAAADHLQRSLQQQLDDERRAHAHDRDAWQADRETSEARAIEADSAQSERRALEDRLRDLEARHARVVEAQAVDCAARLREQAELEALRAAVDEERARRIRVDDTLALTKAEADERVMALELAAAVDCRAIESRLEDAEGRATRLAAEARDAERRLEAHLAQRSSHDHRLAASELFGCALTTIEGRLLRCNDTFARIFGYEDARQAIVCAEGAPFPPMAGRDLLDARLIADRLILAHRVLPRARRRIARHRHRVSGPRAGALGSPYARRRRRSRRAPGRGHVRSLGAREPPAAGTATRGSRHAGVRDGARHRHAALVDRRSGRRPRERIARQRVAAHAGRADSGSRGPCRRTGAAAGRVQPPPGPGAAAHRPERRGHARPAHPHAPRRRARGLRHSTRQG